MTYHGDYTDWLPCLRCGKVTSAPAYCAACLPIVQREVDMREARKPFDVGREYDDHHGYDDLDRIDLERESDEHHHIGARK